MATVSLEKLTNSREGIWCSAASGGEYIPLGESALRIRVCLDDNVMFVRYICLSHFLEWYQDSHSKLYLDKIPCAPVPQEEF